MFDDESSPAACQARKNTPPSFIGQAAGGHVYGSPGRSAGTAVTIPVACRRNTSELRAEALVRNLPGFARFLPVAALFHGQTLNLAVAARDAEISRTTLSGYIEILEDMLLVFRVPAFEGRLSIFSKYWT
jgi:hypothetical protein